MSLALKHSILFAAMVAAALPAAAGEEEDWTRRLYEAHALTATDKEQGGARMTALAAELDKAAEAAPEDPRIAACQVEARQAMDETEKRDAARTRLFELHAKGLADALRYRRERLRLEAHEVTAEEYFELVGENGRKYVFTVRRLDGSESPYVVSLGSYERTNAFMQAMREGPGESRFYHLDGYYPRRHVTYGFFEGAPSYEETRRMVLAVIEGRQEALSSSGLPPNVTWDRVMGWDREGREEPQDPPDGTQPRKGRE